MEQYSAEEKNIIAKLKELQHIQADMFHLDTVKRTITTQIEREIPIYRRNRTLWFLARISAVTACLLLFIGGINLGISTASETNNPESIFYPIKIATEKIQLSLNENKPLNKTNLLLKFAKNRLWEIQLLEEEKINDQIIQGLIRLYVENVQAVQHELDSLLQQKNQDDLLPTLANLEIQLNEITQTIKELQNVLNKKEFNQETTKLISEAATLSQMTSGQISWKILEYQQQQKILLDDQNQLRRISFLFKKMQDRFEKLNSQWYETFSPRLQPLETETVSPEKSDLYQLNKDEEFIVDQLSQIKTDLFNIQTAISVKDQTLSQEQIFSIINTLFAIDTKLATIEALLK